MGREACRPLRTRRGPIAFCSRTKTVRPTGWSSLSDCVNSEKINKKLIFFLDVHILAVILDIHKYKGFPRYMRKIETQNIRANTKNSHIKRPRMIVN